METRQTPYYFVHLSGSAYQIGRTQAAAVKDIPGFRQWLTGNSADWQASYSARAWQTYQRYCPELAEELQGWADELAVDPGALVFSAHTYLVPHCSHFALMPRRSASGHLLVARSYEFDIETHDFRLCYTAPDGKYAHLGNSVLFSGRLDGLNEHRFSVTMSAGGMPCNMVNPKAPPVQEGLQFWAVVRSLLENCRTVDEGLAWLKEIPLGGNPILLLADAGGNAAEVEIFGKKIAARRLARDEGDGYLYATNHFTQPEMQACQSYRMPNSLVRAGRIQAFIAGQTGKVDIADLKRFMSQPYPDGPCCHFYSEGFGTLYSMILDIDAGQMDICLGTPRENAWRQFRFPEVAGLPFQTYPVSLPQEKSPQGFWG